MSWTMWQSTSLANLHITKSWEELTHQMMCCHPEQHGQAGELMRNHMKINKRKWKVLHLGKNNPMHLCRLGTLQRRTWGILEDIKLAKSQQCSLTRKTNSSILSCIRKTIVSRSRKVIFPSTQQWWGHTWNAVPSSGLLSTRKTGTYWNDSRKGHKDD